MTVLDDGVTLFEEGMGDHILIDCNSSNIERAEILLDEAMCGEIK